VKLLLDTHIVYWALTDDPQIPPRLREALEDPAVGLVISAVSVWELAIKCSVGKLALAAPAGVVVARVAEDLSAAMVMITADHAAGVQSLPWHHRDPFDRLLIAQARHEGLVLATVDGWFSQYDVALF
jgi:PIN domain nuclease of toxin-antitoxin system